LRAIFLRGRFREDVLLALGVTITVVGLFLTSATWRNCDGIWGGILTGFYCATGDAETSRAGKRRQGRQKVREYTPHRTLIWRE